MANLKIYYGNNTLKKKKKTIFKTAILLMSYGKSINFLNKE